MSSGAAAAAERPEGAAGPGIRAAASGCRAAGPRRSGRLIRGGRPRAGRAGLRVALREICRLGGEVCVHRL